MQKGFGDYIMEKTFERFMEKYGHLSVEIDGKACFDLDGLRQVLHAEIIDGNMKAIEMLKWVKGNR